MWVACLKMLKEWQTVQTLIKLPLPYGEACYGATLSAGACLFQYLGVNSNLLTNITDILLSERILYNQTKRQKLNKEKQHQTSKHTVIKIS